MPGMPWSVEDIVARLIANLEGHRTLKKFLVCFSRAYEANPNSVSHVQSFIGQCVKAGPESANNKES